MNDYRSSKELKEAWFRYKKAYISLFDKKAYKASGRVGGIPNLVSFTAGFNRAMGFNIPIPKVTDEDTEHPSKPSSAS